MGYLNKVQLIGNLGADPDLRYTPSNRPVCNLSLATSETWNDKEGQKQERTEWHRCQVWGDLAETCEKYLSKGKQVYVEGKLQTRKWQDKQGMDRYTTEIVVDKVVFLGSGGKSDGGQQSQSSGRGGGAGKHREERWGGGSGGRETPDQDPNNGYETAGAGGPTDDDIPF